MSKQRLAYLCGTRAWGGLEMNQFRNCLWMMQRGHQVLLLAKENSPILIQAQQANIPVRIIAEHHRFKYLAASFRLGRILKEEKITHLFVRASTDLNIAAIAKTLVGRKLRLLYFMEMQIGINKKSFLHRARYRKIDHWICPLNYLTEQVVQRTGFNKRKISQLHSAINLEEQHLLDQDSCRESLKLPKGQLLFGLIGRIDPHKGQLLLLQALQIVNDPNVSICFMGEQTRDASNSYLNSLHQFIRENKLSEQVHFLDFQENPSEFYNAVDCVIMASRSETFGMVTVESFAHGKPVIGSASGGTPELIHQDALGFLFETDRADDLAKQMVLFKEKKESFDPNQITQEAKKFDHHQICREIEERYLSK